VVTGRSASDAALLDVLDRGDGLSPPERAILLAHAADLNIDAGILSLGARNRLILGLHRELFGPTIEAYDTCRHCRAATSFEVSCAALDQFGARRGEDEIDLRVGEYDVVCRPPTGADLVNAASATGTPSAKDVLIESTILRARRGGEPVSVNALPPDVVSEVGRAVAEADPLAELALTVTCEACGCSWDTVLDIPDFVWQELRDWGRRLLWEVHVLATAYGWPEGEILTVPPRRRRVYLGLVLDA
jgi:hypothetical protein